jgi:DNA-binding NtrC family response regulator
VIVGEDHRNDGVGKPAQDDPDVARQNDEAVDIDTDVLVAVEEDEPGELCLLVSIHGAVSSHPLGDARAVTLGRSHACDVVIDHASVSRAHAELSVAPLAVRDLGSTNGTRLHGERIAARVSMPLAPGDAFQIGDAVVVVQRAAAARGARAWRGTLLDGRLAEECARSARSGQPFAFVRMVIEPADDPDALRAALETALRATDVFADGGGGQLQLLLLDTPAAAARTVIERVAQRLRASGMTARWGLASWPRDGTTTEQLSAHAWTALRAPAGALAMERVRALVEQIAGSDLSVLVRGETGVGKELCAEMIHRLSSRARRPFVRINCAALGEQLLESELFGHERGAFTGAVAAKPGLIETASGGTLFLDEVGDLPLALQAKLLRVLEDRVVTRVGAISGRTVDVRFVAATNRSLEADIGAGRFRRDLYFRLAGVTIELPPLRERREEIDGLVDAFALRAATASSRRPPAITEAARAALRAHGWPGNVRELKNAIERAVLLCGDGPLGVEHLALSELDGTITGPFARESWEADPGGDTRRGSRPTIPMAPQPAAGEETLRGEVARLEARRVADALQACGGNQTRAARMLGISRNTLQAKMDTFGIPRPRKG